MTHQIILGLVNGLGYGCSLFLVAAGVTLIFGILKVLNFAHGSFLMVGAYVAYTLVGATPSLSDYLLGAVAGAGVVGLLGYLTQITLLRRLRGLDESTTLIATFALLLVCNGMVEMIWGLDVHTVDAPPALSGSISASTFVLPTYTLFLIAVGTAVFLLLDLFIHRLWFGKKIQAVASDSWIAGVLGINTRALFTATVVLAFLLAGFAGGLLLPNQSLSPALSGTFLLSAFVVVIIGGLGNIRGAFVAAILIGVVESLSYIILPGFPGLPSYALMVVFLLWRPQGLLATGSSGVEAETAIVWDAPRLGLPSLIRYAFGALACAVLVTLPLWAGQGILFSAGVAVIMALFALSWNLLFGTSGIGSFGHAAFLTIGAYTVGFGMKLGLAPFGLLLCASVVMGGGVAWAVGLVALRRATGVSLAILTLALCEILRGVIIADSRFGSDDGLSLPPVHFWVDPMAVGLPPASFLYWFILTVAALSTALIWLITHSQSGRILRAMRQDSARVEFLGVRGLRYRLAAFSLSGAIAALSGGLLAPWVRIISPDLAGYAMSTQPMLESLLGGAAYFWGPVVGTAIFSLLSYWTRSLSGMSELINGAILLGVVYAAPTGVLGMLSQAWRRGAGRPSRAATTAAAQELRRVST